MRGLFITFEGNDGSGKSSVIEAIKQELTNQGFDVIYSREPGGSKIAEKIREVILDIDNYMTTLKTTTKCVFVKIPRKLFEKWLYSDTEALKRESKMVARNLLDEGRNERLLLFIQGADRLAFLLIKRYEYYNVKGKLRLDYDRQNIADATGMCIKTVSRAIKQFEDSGLITKDSRKITVDSEQYKKLKEIVLEKLEL